MQSPNNRWLTYWYKTLKYAEIKPIEIINDPLIRDSFHCIKELDKSLADKLWRQAQARQDDTSIEVALCPAQSKIVVEDQYTEDKSVELFWIIVKMDRDGKLFVNSGNKPNSKPFFVRDYLSPNPKNYTALSDIATVDNALASFKFDSNCIESHWKECEALFRKITGKTFVEFNSLERCHLCVEVAPKRGMANNVFTLYKHLLTEDSATDTLKLLSNIINDKPVSKQLYPKPQKVLNDKNHIGQFSGQFPLSQSQRVSMCAFNAHAKGEIIAVNGPPGTGKTTLLQSIVANLTVQHVIDDKPPPLIMASSTNNQAITNILSGFALPDDDDLLTNRWLPDISSLGLYMSSKKSKEYLMYALGDRNKTVGFFGDYEERSADELEASFLKNAQDYLGTAIRSVVHAKTLLKSEILKRQQQIVSALDTVSNFSNIEQILHYSGFESVNALHNAITQSRQHYSELANNTKTWEQSKEALYQTYDSQPFLAKLFRFLPFLKHRRASQFKLIISKVDISALKVTDWSNHHHIIEHIDNLLIKNHEKLLVQKDDLTSKIALKEGIDKLEQDWHHLVIDWNRTYQSKLNTLYDKTGEEYRNLSAQEDINIRLDISYRYEAFWLALHYREADYISKLAKITDKSNAEYGLQTYKAKLQRYACLTPIFISTFYSAPKYSRYFNGKEERSYDELYDYLIVDESGQVAPDIALPTFSLAKTALVVGDTKQIEPIYSVSKPMDTVNYGLYVCEDLDDVSENQLNIHESQGKLGSCGSLMKMAQYANIYEDNPTNSTDSKDLINGLLLTEHRRCVDQIISYCNDYVYSGQLEPMRGKKPDVNLEFILGNKGYVHIDYASEHRGKSRINALEALAIAAWINTNSKVLEKEYGKDIHDIVAVVTPFKPQTLEIKEALSQYKSTYQKITVGTAHALQGAERPLILFSLVASPNDSVSFINSQYNLLNVAVSRARDYFVLFGNMETLAILPRTPLGNLGKWLLNNQDAQIDNSFVYDLVGEGKPSKVYTNLIKEHINQLDRHDEILIEACKRTINELVIVSPFLSDNALSDHLKLELKNAVSRGVVVIVYCDAKLDIDNTKTRRKNSKEAISILQNIGVSIKVIDGIHSKSMMFETDKGMVLVEGSFNWLSAVRDKSNHFSRYEASILLVGESIRPRIESVKKLLKERSHSINH
ncbi:AAA domain-containing protein [Psychrobacter sp. H8-1]|uniref:AAA domain-containing protein n=1 Tax=Psychrobacter sp. H8-1 TaxID=2774129 RepID=UPI00191B631C|nr:AAA domain-containing protein [Psychrobacter sp. H8-1]